MKEFIEAYPSIVASLFTLLSIGLGTLALFMIKKMILGRLDQLDEKLTCLDEKLDINEIRNHSDHARVSATLVALAQRIEVQNEGVIKLTEDVNELKKEVTRMDAYYTIFKEYRNNKR